MIWTREERDALRADARAAEDLYNGDPSLENLKKWGLSLMKSVVVIDRNGVKTFQDAREKLEKVIHESGSSIDYEAMLYLGLVYYDLGYDDISLSNEDSTILHTKAIEYLTRVKKEAPLVYKVPVIYRDSTCVDQLIERLEQELLPIQFPTIESDLIDGKEMQADIRELIEIRLNQGHRPPNYQYAELEAERDKTLMIIQNYELTCKDAKRRSRENPDDGENWKKWGIVLMKLSFYYGSQSIIEAIPKLQKAVELNPNDNEAKSELEEALLTMDCVFGHVQAAAYLESKASEMNERELSGNEIELLTPKNTAQLVVDHPREQNMPHPAENSPVATETSTQNVVGEFGIPEAVVDEDLDVECLNHVVVMARDRVLEVNEEIKETQAKLAKLQAIKKKNLDIIATNKAKRVGEEAAQQAQVPEAQIDLPPTTEARERTPEDDAVDEPAQHDVSSTTDS